MGQKDNRYTLMQVFLKMQMDPYLSTGVLQGSEQHEDVLFIGGNKTPLLNVVDIHDVLLHSWPHPLALWLHHTRGHQLADHGPDAASALFQFNKSCSRASKYMQGDIGSVFLVFRKFSAVNPLLQLIQSHDSM